MTTIRDALEKLVVKSGGIGTCKNIDADWMLCLFEAPRDSEFVYVLSLRYRDKKQAIGLTSEQVYTKGKSAWRRDNTWRLRPEIIDLFEKQIEKTIMDARTRGLT